MIDNKTLERIVDPAGTTISQVKRYVTKLTCISIDNL